MQSGKVELPLDIQQVTSPVAELVGDEVVVEEEIVDVGVVVGKPSIYHKHCHKVDCKGNHAVTKLLPPRTAEYAQADNQQRHEERLVMVEVKPPHLLREYRCAFAVVGHDQRKERTQYVDKVGEVEKPLPLERQAKRSDVHCGVAQVQRQSRDPRIACKVVELGFQTEVEQSHPSVVHQYQTLAFEGQILQYHVQYYR